MTRVSLTGAFHDLLAKLRICCYGSTTTFIVKNAILKPKLNGLMYFELWFYFAFKSKQKWNQQSINKKKFSFLIIPFKNINKKMLPESKIYSPIQFGLQFDIFKYKGSWWTITTNPHFSHYLRETYQLLKLLSNPG